MTLSQDSFCWEPAPLQHRLGHCIWSPKPKSCGRGGWGAHLHSQALVWVSDLDGQGLEEGLSSGTRSLQWRCGLPVYSLPTWSLAPVSCVPVTRPTPCLHVCAGAGWLMPLGPTPRACCPFGGGASWAAAHLHALCGCPQPGPGNSGCSSSSMPAPGHCCTISFMHMLVFLHTSHSWFPHWPSAWGWDRPCLASWRLSLHCSQVVLWMSQKMVILYDLSWNLF